MSHVRITARFPGGAFVDRWVEIRNADRVEVALAKAAAEPLGGPCAARPLSPEEAPPSGFVSLHAYDGPRLAAGDSRAAEVLDEYRLIGRFEVVRTNRRRDRAAGPWFGAKGELRPRARRG
ncbi:MAG: hypothetical protein F4041_13975 [Acidobacteriia bacterium]|nr:hypothetical protein [Terriglobia bacterium]